MNHWVKTHSCDIGVRALADRHYSRQTPGSPRFTQSGKALTFKVPGTRIEPVYFLRKRGTLPAGRWENHQVADAGWVSFWPIAEFVRHAWAGSWQNQFFHNESAYPASQLIREAVYLTVALWGQPPSLGMVTMIDPDKVLSGKTDGAVVGYSYRRAGFKHVGHTKSKPYKKVFQLTPEKIMNIYMKGFAGTLIAP